MQGIAGILVPGVLKVPSIATAQSTLGEPASKKNFTKLVWPGQAPVAQQVCFNLSQVLYVREGILSLRCRASASHILPCAKTEWSLTVLLNIHRPRQTK